MACGARLGLKPEANSDRASFAHAGEMACGARLGLKLGIVAIMSTSYEWRNGLWSPFGIETLMIAVEATTGIEAKWPVEPVWD